MFAKNKINFSYDTELSAHVQHVSFKPNLGILKKHLCTILLDNFLMYPQN